MKKGILMIILVSWLCACQTVELSTSDLNEKIDKIENRIPVMSARGLLFGDLKLAVLFLLSIRPSYNHPG